MIYDVDEGRPIRKTGPVRSIAPVVLPEYVAAFGEVRDQPASENCHTR